MRFRGSRGRWRDGVVVLDASFLEEATRRILRAALRLLWRREGWPMGGMGLDDWEAAARVCLGEETARDFPGGTRVRRSQGMVRVGAISEDRP